MASTEDDAARELGRRGGLKGGRARALALTPEARAVIAAKGAQARWHGGQELAYATHTGELKIGEVTIPCYVLNDGRRVLSKAAISAALDLSPTGGKTRAVRVTEILGVLDQKGLKTSEISARTEQIVRFSNLGAPGVVHGIEAAVLVDLCKVFLEARRLGILSPQAQRIAARCEVLLTGFAQVGVVALIDEATGYQQDRVRDALATILEQFIARELRPWVSTFPSDFYKHIFRLHGWDFVPASVKRPGCVGYMTTDLVYQRLAPGVLEELKRLTPRNAQGRPTHKLHQRLSLDTGHPKLREHLTGVVYLLKAANTWRGFKDQLDHVVPRIGDTLLLDFGAADRMD